MKASSLYCILIVVGLMALVDADKVIKQRHLQTAFKEASQLNDQQEYLLAAQAFREVQTEASCLTDYDLLLRSITAEGECYYMLDMMPQISEKLEQAKEVYTKHVSSVDKLTRWQWEEAIAKLEGSYNYCLTSYNSDAYQKAIESYSSCLVLIDSMQASPSIDDEEMRVTIFRELTGLHYKQKEYTSALREMEKVYQHYLNLGYPDQPMTSDDTYFTHRYIDAVLSYALIRARLNQFEEAEEALSNLPPQSLQTPAALRTKGKIAMLHYYFDGTDLRQDAKNYYDRYITLQKSILRNQLSQMSETQREQYWLGMHDFLFDCYRLEDYATDMLYDLALYCKGYLIEHQLQKAKIYTWKDVQKHLDNQSCAIEFVIYNGANETKQLGALVVTKDSKQPSFIHIANVDSLRNYPLNRLTTLAQAVTSTNSTNKNFIYDNTELAKRIWTEPLLKATKGAKKLYFAPDGLLNQLAIEYMMPDTGISCRRLTSTKGLASLQNTSHSDQLLLMGDIDYKSQQLSSRSNNDELAFTFFIPYASGLRPLSSTKSEIEAIADTKETNEAKVISGQEATDEAFCINAPLFPYIHIATHGLFVARLEDATDLKPLLCDNCMSQSGLAFAGAQYSLRDPKHNASLWDGMLSAKEIANLPLDNVELIVLSACQTGNGYITADGVYGVQRALKQAGVGAMIVSLWDVNDEATSILMTNFYRNLKETEDIHDAFYSARKQLMEEVQTVFNAGSMSTKKTNKYAAPQYADAFILIDVI